MICGLLSYYDEPPKLVRQLIESFRVVGITHLVAVDGAYALFPGGKPESPEPCRKAIRQACYQNNIKLTHHTPEATWPDEIAKRSFLFELAETVTTPTDWYAVVDGDEEFIRAPKGLPGILDGLKARVATVELLEPGGWQSLRMLFRAERGIRVKDNHYTYVTPDGTKLWGNHRDPEVVPAAYTPVLVRHRNHERDRLRLKAGLDYYKARDSTAIERHTCAWCGAETSFCIPYGWFRTPVEVKGPRTGCCDDCYPRRSAESIEQAAALGEDASHLFPARRVNVFR